MAIICNKTKMKIIVNSKDLYNRLFYIRGVVPKNPTLPILECFLFEVKENVLHMTSSDLHIIGKTAMPIEHSDEGRIAIPANILMDTLSKVANTALTISIDEETYSTKIVTDNGNYEISSENPLDFPPLPDIEGATTLSLPAKVLKDAINQTAYAISTDEVRLALNGVLMKLHQDLTFVTTDGHRMVKYTQNGYKNDAKKQIIIPKKAIHVLKELSGSGEKEDIETEKNTEKQEVKIDFNPSWASFSFRNVTLYCRLIDERFPDYENVFPKDYENTLSIEREPLRQALERMVIYSNRDNSLIRLHVKGNQLSLSAEDLDYSNKAQEEIPCQEHQGKDIEIGFNARFLIDVCKTLKSPLVTILLGEVKQPVLFSPTQEKGKDITALVMPVLLNN